MTGKNHRVRVLGNPEISPMHFPNRGPRGPRIVRALTELGGSLEYLELFVLARVLLPQDKQVAFR
jgi:hypothetical protein